MANESSFREKHIHSQNHHRDLENACFVDIRGREVVLGRRFPFYGAHGLRTYIHEI